MTSECKHEPGPIAAFEWTCKHCHKLIEAVHCKECDGFGEDFRNSKWDTCGACKGSGVEKWRLA